MRIAEADAQSGGQQSLGFMPLEFATKELRSEIEKKVEEAYQPAIEIKIQFTIDIPAISIVAKGTGSVVIEDFDIDTQNLRWFGSLSDEIVLENLKSGDSKQIQSLDEYTLPDGYTPVTYIINAVLDANELVDYETNADLLVKLATQFLEGLKREYAENKINGVLAANIKDIARELSGEINRHSRVIPPEHEAVLLKTATAIKTETYTKTEGVEVKKYTDHVPDYALKKTVFGGFARCCINCCKFDSDPERIFSVILETDKTVERWLRPAVGQLSITYASGERYQPDFIVETTNAIYIIEIKASNQLDEASVTQKANAAKAFCTHANAFNRQLNPTAKPWQYALISADRVARNMTLDALLRTKHL